MKKYNIDPAVKLFITIIGIVVTGVALKELEHILLPFTIAYLLFLAFSPLNKILTKHRVPKSLTVIIDLIILAVILFGFFNVVLSSLSQFSEQLPRYQIKLNHIVGNFFQTIGVDNSELVNFNIADMIKELDISGILTDLFSSTVSVFTAFVFILLFFIFISTSHEIVINAIKKRYSEVEIRRGVNKYRKRLDSKSDSLRESKLEEKLERIRKKRTEKVELTFLSITQQVQKFISLKFALSLFMGFLVGLILYLINIEFYIIFGILTVFLNFIPNLGSVIGVFLSSLMVLVQYESVGFTLVIALILIALQNVVGNFLEPKIFGNRLGINPLVILLSLLIWGYIWGIAGMFLAVPLTAIINIVFSGSRSKNIRFLHDLMST